MGTVTILLALNDCSIVSCVNGFGVSELGS